MKKRLLPFAFIALFCCLLLPAKAQVSTDTFTLYVQNQFWKTGQPVTGTHFLACCVPIFGPPTAPVLSVIHSPDSSGVTIKYILDSLSDANCYFGEKNFKGGDINGMNIGDLARMAHHILGLQPFISSYAKLAADVNRSNSITTFDIVEVRKIILGIYQEFPTVDPWIIVPETIPANYFGCLRIPQTPTSLVDTSRIVSIKMGDVDGDANPVGFYQLPQNSKITLGVPNNIIQAGETVWIPIVLAQDATLTGIQFGAKFDHNLFEIKDVRSVAMGWDHNSFGLFQDAFSCAGITPNILPGSFPASTAIMEIQVKALQTFSPQQAIQLSQERTPGLWLDENLVLHGLDSTFAISSAQFEPVAPGVTIGLPTPNPFTEKTAISLTLEFSTVVYLELTDAAGKLLLRQSHTFSEGLHNLEISGNDLPANSLLFYRIWSENWSSSGKILHR